MKELKRKFTLRTALTAALTLALVASATVFMAASAAENVTPSDVSGGDMPKSSASHTEVSLTDVSPTDLPDAAISRAVIRAIRSQIIAPAAYATPENLGEPVITMTTEKAVGEELNLTIAGDNVYVDYGDGTPVAYPGDNTVKGGTIKIYGNGITELGCDDNKLTSLNVSGCAELSGLSCEDNQLSTLDVKNKSALSTLIFDGNPLKTLDVSGCTSLTTLLASGEGTLEQLNASGCSSLDTLWCHDNKVASLDVSGCTALTDLTCYNNQLTALDISDCVALTELNCHTNQLSALNISNNTNLEYLGCSHNPIQALDVSNNRALIYLICQNIQLSNLDVSQNENLEVLLCSDSQLGTLDVSHNLRLTDLQCDCCDLSSLDVSKNTELTFLDFVVNNVSSIDLSNNTKLKTLRASGNNLTSLNLSNNPALNRVECEINSIPFSGFRGITGYDEFTYAPQTEYQIPSSVKVGESIDLSSEYSVGGTVTEFTWYDTDGNVVNPATANGGVFTFGEDAVGNTLVCKMANAKLPDFSIGTESYEEYDDEGNPTGNIWNVDFDYRLTTTAVTIEAAESDEPEDPVSPEEPVSSEDNSDNNGNGKVTPYYDLPFEQNEDIDDVTAVKYPEGTVVDVDGRVRNLHSLRGIQLTVGNIETNKKKSVLDAIKHYNETFDTDTTDIALYDITLEDNNKVHVKLVGSELLICLKYPDNLARRSEDYVFHLYHQKEDGTIEEIPVTCKPNGIWFRATDFSPYALYWHVKTAESVGTGESTAMIIVMTTLLAMSLAGAGFVLYRRRKQTAA